MWSAFAGRLLYLDTNIVIYAIEESSDWPTVTRNLLTAIDDGIVRAATSELTIAEVMPKPLKLHDRALTEKFESFLSSPSALMMQPIDRKVLLRAADLQASGRLKLFDAIHVATALMLGCDYFLTEDDRLGRNLESILPWIRLSEITQ